LRAAASSNVAFSRWSRVSVLSYVRVTAAFGSHAFSGHGLLLQTLERVSFDRVYQGRIDEESFREPGSSL
jgi:hypothetical protein